MKALFFLRHYNDIDHITPVIFKWVKSGHVCDVVLIGHRNIRNDYRIEFLRKLPDVRVAHIRDVLTPLQYLLWRLQTLLLSPGMKRSLLKPLAQKAIEIYGAGKRQQVWRDTAGKVLERSFAGSGKGVVVFDWVTRNSPVCIEWVETVIAMAHDKDLGAVSLPHGDSPHANHLIRRGEWKLQPDTMYSAGCLFERVSDQLLLFETVNRIRTRCRAGAAPPARGGRTSRCPWPTRRAWRPSARRCTASSPCR